MKKALSLLLAGVMVLSLSGCVSSTGGNTKDLIDAIGSAVADADSSTSSTNKSNSTSTTNKSNTTTTNKNTTLTDAQIKTITENALYSKVKSVSANADPGSCRYKINKTVKGKNAGEYSVYGTVSLYDKYGKLISGKAQMSFTVEIANGKAKKTTITK